MSGAATEVPSPGRALGFAFVAGSTALLAGGGVLAVAYEARPLKAANLSAGLWAALLLLVLRVPLEGLAARLLGPRGRVAWWLAMAVGAVSLGVSTWADADHSLHASWRFAYGDPRLWEPEPWAFGVAAATAIAAGAWARAPFPSRRALRRVGAAIAAGALVLTGGLALRWMRAPSIDRYVDAAPLIDQVPRVPWHESEPGASARSSTRFVDRRLRDTPLTLRRYTFDDGGGCALRLGADVSALPPVVARQDEDLFGCGPLDVRRDLRLRALYVTAPSAWSTQTRAFDLDSGRAWPEGRAALSTFAPNAAAPRSWLVAAAGALALGLLAVLSRSDARWWSTREEWRQGTLGPDGVLSLETDGAQVGGPFGSALTTGPVVLRTYESRNADAPFRAGPRVGMIRREDVRAGTLTSVAAELESRMDARLAYALFAALVATAATVPMWLEGLAP